jgi:hypothetical protein
MPFSREISVLRSNRETEHKINSQSFKENALFQENLFYVVTEKQGIK